MRSRARTPPPTSRKSRSSSAPRSRLRSSTPPAVSSRTRDPRFNYDSDGAQSVESLPPSAKRYMEALKRATPSQRNKNKRKDFSPENSSSRSFCGEFLEDNTGWVKFEQLGWKEKTELMETLAKAVPSDVSYRALPTGEYLVCYNPQAGSFQDQMNSTYASMNGSMNQTQHHSLSPNNNTAKPVITQRTVGSYLSQESNSFQEPKPLIFETLTGCGRVRSSIWLVRLIEDIYSSRLQTFKHEVASATGRFESFPIFVQQHLEKKFGLENIVKQAAEDLLRNINDHKDKNQLVSTFGIFLLSDGQYDEVDQLFYLLARTVASKEIIRGANKLKYLVPFRLLPHVTKNIVGCQPQSLLHSCMQRVKSLIRSSTGVGVDMYEYLAMLLKEYKLTRNEQDENEDLIYGTKGPLEIPVAYRMRKIDLWVLVTLRNVVKRDKLARTTSDLGALKKISSNSFDRSRSDLDVYIGRERRNSQPKKGERNDLRNSSKPEMQQSQVDQLLHLQEKLREQQAEETPQTGENELIMTPIVNDADSSSRNNTLQLNTPYLEDADDKTLEEHVESLGVLGELWDASMLDQIKQKLKPVQPGESSVSI